MCCKHNRVENSEFRGASELRKKCEAREKLLRKKRKWLKLAHVRCRLVNTKFMG
jgi:hypothetical protein